jgi:hypothetical protein
MGMKKLSNVRWYWMHLEPLFSLTRYLDCFP